MSCLTARASCQALNVCPAWRKWGPTLLRSARWRGHPAARRLRSRPHAAGWRGLHVAETLLLLEDFRDACRWRPLGDAAGPAALAAAAAQAQAPGVLRTGGRDDEPGAPMIAAALGFRFPKACRPRLVRVRLRCLSRNMFGQCAAYVALDESEARWSESAPAPGDPGPPVMAFVAWHPRGGRHGSSPGAAFARRIVGLLGGDGALTPSVDDARLADEIELELRLSWRRRGAAGFSGGGGGHLLGATLQVGPFARAKLQVEVGAPLRGLRLGAGRGSHVQFLEVFVQ
mmetsp:Transcript_48047/g.153697  ORF Transcript_48047/g.153697 Transcript_48047/m.153697 type:complete len:286 (+) Transcript_48047:355-1212(+)